MKAYTYDVFHRCESTTDWTPVLSALAVDSTQKVEGKYSIKMTSDNNEFGAMFYDRTVDWSDFQRLTFSVYHSGYTTETGQILLYTDAVNYSGWNFAFAGVWTEVSIDILSAPDIVNGTLDLSNITSIKIYSTNTTTPGEDYYFDNFRGRTGDVSGYVENVRIRGGIFPIIKSASFITHPDHEKYFVKTHIIEILDDSDELIFSGVLMDKNRGVDGLYRYVVNSYYNEAHLLTYVKAFSSDKSSEKIQDVIDNSFNFIKRDSSITATTIDYDYSLNRQSAALINMIRFMERQVISVEPNGLMRTKDYDGLSKAPQHFPGTYNFRDDANGSTPDDWTDNSGGTCTALIIAELNGHKKVLELDVVSTNEAWVYNTFTATASGAVEAWIRTTNVTKRSRILFLSSNLTNTTSIYIDSSKIRIHNGGFIDCLDPMVNDTWYHIKITFECGDGGYDGLASDTFNVYIDGVKTNSDIAFTNVRDTVNRLDCRAGDSAGSGWQTYVDAIGFSWDANYKIGDNAIAWNLNNQHQSVMLIEAREFKTGYYRGSLGITRASVRMVGNVIRTKPDDRTDTEQAIGVNPLKEYRDLKLVANAEADQLATNLFEIFSLETEFIALRVEGEGFTKAGETLDIANTGSIPIAQGDFCVISYVYDPKADVYLEMIVSNNIVLPKEFMNNFDTSQLQIHQANLQTFENATAIENLTGISEAYGENLTERVETGTSYAKMKEIEAMRDMGNILISWEQKRGAVFTEHRTKVYVNGVAKSGAFGSNSDVWTTYTYEFTEGISDGDLVQIYGLVYTLGRECRVKNMRISYSWLANATF